MNLETRGGIEAVMARNTPRHIWGRLCCRGHDSTSQTIWKEMYLVMALLDAFLLD